MPTSEYNEHHLVPTWILKDLRSKACRLIGRKLRNSEIKATKRHVKVKTLRTVHQAWHELTDGFTVMEVYERISEIYEAMLADRWVHRFHPRTKTPRQSWEAIFGNDADAHIATRKLTGWMYYYLFHKFQNARDWNHVYTPEDLFADDARKLKHIFQRDIGPSPYKRHAMRLLFGTHRINRISQAEMQHIYDNRLSFE